MNEKNYFNQFCKFINACRLCVISGFHRDVRSALFGDFTQRKLVIPYRRFGTTYPSHLQGSRILEDGTDRLSRNIGTELSLRCVKSQKSAHLFCELSYNWLAGKVIVSKGIKAFIFPFPNSDSPALRIMFVYQVS